MTESDAPFELIQEGNATILVLLPELNNVQWGDIDAIGTEVLNSISEQNHPNIVVDLTPLNYMGSAMVALIVRVWKAAQAKNGKISVACSHEGVKEVLKLASLDKVWPIVDDRDEAKRALGIRSKSGTAASSSPGVGGGGSANTGWIVASILLVICLILAVFAFNPGLFGVKPDQAKNPQNADEVEPSGEYVAEEDQETADPAENEPTSEENPESVAADEQSSAKVPQPKTDESQTEREQPEAKKPETESSAKAEADDEKPAKKSPDNPFAPN